MASLGRCVGEVDGDVITESFYKWTSRELQNGNKWWIPLLVLTFPFL